MFNSLSARRSATASARRQPFAPSFTAPLFRRLHLLLVAAFALTVLAGSARAQCVSLTTAGSAYTQNFNTLSNTAGSTTNNLTITGWFLTETGGGARDNEQYAVDTGGSNTGDTYSYGPAGNTDRALGGLQSGTLIPVIGACFTNNTGAALSSLDIAYTGEQWRISNTAAARDDRLDFQYSLNATSLATGTWTDVNALDFTNPIKTAASASALDGNSAANRTAVSSSISSLSIANGATFWIRWNDLNASGADDGLAVDDFSLTPQGAGGGGGVTLSINDVSQDEGSGGGTTAYTFTVSLSSSTHGGVTFDIATVDGTAQDDNPATEDNDYVAQSLIGQTIPNGSNSYMFTVNVNGDTVIEPNETFFVNVTNVTGATVTDGQGQGTITNDDVTLTLINAVQGNGAASPLAGQSVTVRGIVTLLKSNGFFLQEETADNDADPNTSEGIFVFTSSAPTVAVGEQATVTGTVTEFNGLTELTSPSVLVNSTGNTLPTAVTLDATILSPTAPADQSHLEKYEAMRLSAASLRSVSPNDGFFDIETVLPAVPRQQVFREPGIPAGNTIPPDPTSGTPDPNIPIWDRNPEKINLDTNGRAGATGVGYTSNVTFSNVAGPLDFSFGRYRLVPEAGFSASTNISATPAPTPSANEFTVVGYNIENFNNNATQREKAALTIRTILHYPDIVGTVEIFNLAALQALRDEINNDAVAAGDPNPMYEAYLIPTPVAGITQNVGFLVKTTRVQVNSVTQERAGSTYIRPTDSTTDETHDRPPLVLSATVDPSGANPQPVIVVVNHTRSFIDVEMVAGDGLNARAKRKAQAEDIADLFNDLQTANAGVPVIGVGDYNAFEFNNGYDDPLSVMRGTPRPDDQIVVDQSPDLVDPDFFNLIENVPAAERYSFFFDDDGAMQVLDHVLVNTTARARNTRVHIAHVNSDFPGSPAAAFANDPMRVEQNSDHDPTIAYFALGQPQTAGTLIISEFRFRGPGFTPVFNGPACTNGASPDTMRANGPALTNTPGTAAENDEFVELYNNTDSDITVQTLDGSGGWALVASDGVVRFVVPNGTVIPARGHYLGANSDGYSLSCACAADASYTANIPDNGGVALFRTANPALFTDTERLDAAGYSTAPALYREGTGLPTGGPETTTDSEHSFFRNFTAPGGRPIDTGNNAADFLGASTDGAGTGLGQRLGAPGPENLTSPIERNGAMPLARLDATKPAASAPNRSRDFTSDPMNNSTFGTLTIRRRVTNNTGQDVTQLRFRLINITTFPPATSGTADLRARTSGDVMISDIMDAATCAAAGQTAPCTVTVTGTVLEEPPAQPEGGGWNSTLSVPVSIPDGDSVNVQFVLGIEQTGAFRFYINTEVVTGSVTIAPRTTPFAPGTKQKAASR